MAGVEAWRVFGTIGLKGLGKTGSQLTAFNAAGVKVGKTVAGIDKKMLLLAGGAAVAGGAVVMLGAKSVRAFADFDAAMTESLAIMGDVSEVMETKMVRAAEKTGQTTLFSATQAAESYFFLASAGLDAEQSIAALPQVAAFAQAGMFDMARATDLATDAQSALGLTVDDAQQNLRNLTRVTDVLVKANTLANASVEQFATALTSEAGAALKTVNKDIEEGVAVLAAYADQGIKAEKAGSSLSRVIRMLTAQAVKNSEAYEQLGIAVFDSDGNMRNFADIVEDLEQALLPMNDRLRAASLESLGFRARLQGIILPLLGTSKAIREYEAAQRDANGITKEVAEKQLDTLKSQLGLTANAFGVLLAKIGGFITETGRVIPALKLTREWIVLLTESGEAYSAMWTDAGNAIEEFGKKIPGVARLHALEQSMRDNAEATKEAAEHWSEFNTALLESRETFPIVDDILGDIREKMVGLKFPKPDALVPDTRDLDRDLLLNPPGFDLPDIAVVSDPLAEIERELKLDERRRKIAEGLFGDPSQDDPQIATALAGHYSSVWNDAGEDALAQTLPTFKQLGGDLMRGLVSGSFDAGEFIAQSMITIASNFILGPLSSFLGIASPSRVTAEMGRQMVAGLEMGILEGARSGGVARAWASVVSSVPAASAAGISPSMSLDLSGMPPARNPLASARDRDWQEFFRDSARAARADGAE